MEHTEHDNDRDDCYFDHCPSRLRAGRGPIEPVSTRFLDQLAMILDFACRLTLARFMHSREQRRTEASPEARVLARTEFIAGSLPALKPSWPRDNDIVLVISCRCRLGEDRGNWGCVVRERPQQREPHRCEQRDRSKTDRHNEKGILCDGRELFPTAFRQPGSVVGTRSQRMNLISHLLVNLHRTRRVGVTSGATTTQSGGGWRYRVRRSEDWRHELQSTRRGPSARRFVGKALWHAAERRRKRGQSATEN